MYQIGLDVSAATVDQKFALGTVVFVPSQTAGIKGYMYVKDSGSGITGDGYVVDIDVSTFFAVMSTTTTTAPGTGAGKPVGVARSAWTASYFGWVQIYGPGVIRTAASAAAYTRLNSTATAGQVDDDATASSEIIEGLVLDVATGGAAATTAGFIQWPKVANTL